MSSGFVPAGTTLPEKHDGDGSAEDAAWAAARANVAQAAAPKQDAAAADGRSLYEILQANKARKQEEFEEKMKFKNQFRALDEGDVEYLDSIVEEKKRAERERRREMERELEKFRGAQSVVDSTGKEGEREEVGWGKRKRREGAGKGKGVGVKVRRTGEKGEGKAGKEEGGEVKEAKGEKEEGKVEKVDGKEVGKEEEKKEPVLAAVKPKVNPPTGGLGLVDYSDSDDD